MLIQQAKRLRYGHTDMGEEEGILKLDLGSAVRTLRCAEPHTTCSIQLGQEGILRKFDLTSDFDRLQILAVCNGLMIVRPYRSSPDTLYLVNVITKQSVKLPPPPYTVNPPTYDYPFVGFAFVPSTGEYKVVLLRGAAKEGASKPKRRKKMMIDQLFKIQILTFGGSGGGGSYSYDDLHWRVFQAPWLSTSTCPFEVNGVLYWSGTYSNRLVTCFDPIEERFYICPCPGVTGLDTKEGLLEMAGYPAFWIYSHNHQQLDFWILKNFHTGGEWIMYSSTRIGDQGIASCIDKSTLRPILSYGSNGEVLIFKHRFEENLLAYNMRSSIWWKMGNNVKVVGDTVSFRGFHVNKILPLDSLLKKKATSLTGLKLGMKLNNYL